jgi:hypothetical protein
MIRCSVDVVTYFLGRTSCLSVRIENDDVVESYLPTFRRNMLLSSSGHEVMTPCSPA